MRKLVFLLLSFVALGGAIYLFLPSNMQYAVQDAIKRPFSPNFDLPPGLMKSAQQDQWIAEYKNRGYNLHCYANLRPEEKISADDDYNCWAIVKSAFDNVPAQMVVFWFHKGELQHIKIEFPDSSFKPLQAFLARHFEGVNRLDQQSNRSFGNDIYGKPLMVWPTQHGIVVTSKESTAEQSLTLLWTSREKLTRDLLTDLLPRQSDRSNQPTPVTDNAAPQINVEKTPVVTTATVVSAAPVVVPPQPAPLPQVSKAPVSAKATLKNTPLHKSTDLRHCLSLSSNAAIAKCTNQ